MSEPGRIRLGISSCLLGERVRFDGNHKFDPYISGTLGRHFDFVSVCPEVAVGLGVPRPTIRLSGDPRQPRVIGVKVVGLDVTDALAAFSRRQVAQLGELSGYILKGRSPSCGMERVKVYQEAGRPPHSGSGVYAAALMARWPLLPVEEEGRLGDPELRDNFLERVFAYRRWQELLAGGLGKARLQGFHEVHKLSLMAHGADHYRALGRLVADLGARPIKALADEYIAGFMAALRQRATPKKQANVLQHVMGYLKRHIEPADKQEINEAISAYREGRVPLLVPITLLRHHLRRYPDPYLARQVYLNPGPDELLLRRGGV
jgi:uncharacterized protein YbgA (DUF1722 family)/uncharacterized protein YbbK (DUF523 family)